jgi:hypothetical protein
MDNGLRHKKFGFPIVFSYNYPKQLITHGRGAFGASQGCKGEAGVSPVLSRNCNLV